MSGLGGRDAPGIQSEAESQGRAGKMSLFTGVDVSQGALRLEIIEEKRAHARVTGGRYPPLHAELDLPRSLSALLLIWI